MGSDSIDVEMRRFSVTAARAGRDSSLLLLLNPLLEAITAQHPGFVGSIPYLADAFLRDVLFE